jgi:DNA processing protein
LDCLKDPQVAIVGSRHPTPGGLENTASFTKFLASVGLTITSGLARGIDAVAHETALTNGGISIAVAATGLDRVYPAMHRELAQRIASQGALVSEFPLGTPVKAQHFPQRNRIISGLSLGTLVVEAARRSGSLITARFAAEQGRDVFALPGSIHNPVARGCHKLIRQGATLVENPQDILEQLASQIELSDEPALDTAEDKDTSLTLDDDYRLVLDTLGHDPTSIDTLVERSTLTSEAVSSMLLILELKGYVASTAGGLYVRLGKEYSE